MRATDLVPMSTPEQVGRAVAAIPRTADLALEGNDFYAGLLFITGVGLWFAPFNLAVDYWKKVLPDA